MLAQEPVGASSVTVEATDGTTTTVPVGSNTAIARNGSRSTLPALKAGDQVVVHVVPSGTGTVVRSPAVVLPARWTFRSRRRPSCGNVSST